MRKIAIQPLFALRSYALLFTLPDVKQTENDVYPPDFDWSAVFPYKHNFIHGFSLGG